MARICLVACVAVVVMLASYGLGALAALVDAWLEGAADADDGPWRIW